MDIIMNNAITLLELERYIKFMNHYDIQHIVECLKRSEPITFAPPRIRMWEMMDLSETDYNAVITAISMHKSVIR